ncbi:ribosomal rna large subunit methyltransferase j protein, partial [Cystoisospora suis]
SSSSLLYGYGGLRREDVIDREFSEITEAETRSSVLLVGQLLQALTLLRDEGDFLLRFHSSYTRFTSSLLYLLSFSFSNVALHTPPSIPLWRSHRFFLAYRLRPAEANETAKALAVVWDKLIEAYHELSLKKRLEKKKREEEEKARGERKRRNEEEEERRLSSSAFSVDDGNVWLDEARWIVSQCLSAKLFTGRPLTT